MKKQLIVFVLAAVVAAPAWTATDGPSAKEEKIGLGAGAAAGAILGGPIGLIIGAALGGWTGDKFGNERDQRRDAQAQFAAASSELESLADLFSRSEAQLEVLQARISSQESSFRDALGEVSEVEVFFHTGQAALDPGVHQRLIRLGRVMQLMDDFAVVIEGHADARGDADYNEQLSAQRAAAVREALMQSGLSADRISAQASGERHSVAAENDLDAMALERKVNLSVVRPNSGNRVAAK